LKLRTHFVVLVAATLLPVLVLAVTVVLLVQRERHASVQRGLQDTARALAAAVDRELDSSVTALETLGDSPALDTGNLPAFYEHARRAREDNRRWLSVYLVEPPGRQVMTLLRPLGAPLPWAGDLDYVRAVIQTRRPYTSDLSLGMISQRHIITINIPVLRDGRLRYVLGASLMTEALGELLAQQVGPTRSIAAIRDRQGALVARSRDQGLHIGRPPSPQFAEALRRARAGGESLFETDSLEGEHVYAAASGVPTADFMVVVATPAAAFAALRYWWLLWVGGAVIFVSALGVSTHLARRVARPIAELSKAAGQLAEGEPVPTAPSSVPEISAVRDAIVRAADALRERATERARRVTAERMSREKDEFLAMLGHELRNPLGAIASAVSVLDRVSAGEKLAIRAREIVARQVAHLVGIVDDLLDVSRVSVGKILLTRRPLDLGELVQRTVRTLDAEGRTVRHDVTVDAAPAWVDGDETRLEQVVGNLLANALKYTPSGGHIHVAVHVEAGDVVVRVQDDGIGIAPDRLGSIFDLFFQGERGLDRAQGGLGIGLTLVKRLVELHGGTVVAASEGPDRGSTFTVRLPAVPMARAPRPPARTATPSRPRRVLLIEDNADAREMLRSALELSGHTVEEAADGRDGLARAEAEPPDVAVIDIGLPGIDGYEVARRLRRLAEGGDMFLIALTGYGQPEDRRRSEEAGFDAHLVKPVDPDALERALTAERRR
jgi:signal transduction histidine kinase/ActR/RegA family two-component response regulator